MKKALLILSAVLLIASCFLVYSCTSPVEVVTEDPEVNQEPIDNPDVQQPKQSEQQEPQVDTKTIGEMCSSISGFGFNVFEGLLEQAEGDMLFSPMSLSIALSMVATGAMGPTANQIAAAQGLDGFTGEEIAQCYKTVVDRFTSADDLVKVLSANGVWVDKNFPVYDTYKSDIEKYFDTEVTTADFGAPGVVRNAVNEWAAKHTENKITNVILDDPKPPMLLANALYFNAGWGIEFDEDIIEGPFHGVKGDVPAEYFTKTDMFACTNNGSLMMLSIPYGSGTFDFVAVVPVAGQTIGQAFKDLNSKTGQSYLRSLVPTQARHECYVQVPRFTVESDYRDEQIKQVLQGLGIVDAFDDVKSDFGGISPMPLKIEDIIQKDYISVDEKGTEAAAVTVVEMEATSLGEEGEPELLKVVLDRPFIFLVRDTGTGAVLFVGVKQ